MKDTHALLSAEGEAEYLDNGGAMTIERRDHYFSRAMNALLAAENQAADTLRQLTAERQTRMQLEHILDDTRRGNMSLREEILILTNAGIELGKEIARLKAQLLKAI